MISEVRLIHRMNLTVDRAFAESKEIDTNSLRLKKKLVTKDHLRASHQDNIFH